MKTKSLIALSLASVFAASSAYADHNSLFGEGWANMPNDIHNVRIDTKDSDTSDFTDFVKYGNGSDSVNRFSTTTSTSRGGSSASRGGRS